MLFSSALNRRIILKLIICCSRGVCGFAVVEMAGFASLSEELPGVHSPHGSFYLFSTADLHAVRVNDGMCTVMSDWCCFV